LCTIQQILALLGRLLDLFGRGRLLQCLIGGVQLTLQLVHFLPNGYELMACVFVFPQRDNGLGHFFRVNLRHKVDLDHDRVSIKGGAHLLIQDEHEPGCVSADFIFGDVHAVHHRDAFQVGSDLFQSIPLGRFGGQADRVFSRIPVAHAIFALSIDDSDFRKHRRREGSG
jgi:hypothetical protein